MAVDFVFPRDAFNAANLYKCIGKLYLAKLDNPFRYKWELSHPDAFKEFPVPHIDPYTGDLCIKNIHITKDNEIYTLMIPCNSREPWPMYLLNNQEESFPVFNEAGEIVFY